MTGELPFSHFVRHLGRGPGRSRHLTREEAREAMRRVLEGTVAPEAVGAMLMLMRYRTENAEEVAGFIEAMRGRCAAWSALPVDLDWPSYASGRSRGMAWFVLSAALVARAGLRVLLHGYNSHHLANPVSPGHVIDALGLPVVHDPVAAAAALEARGIAYVPLKSLERRFLNLVDLRDVFGLRSPVNTCLRGLNPAGAPASVQGVFHPPYRELQRDAAQLLGQETMIVIKGGGGEVERHPGKPVEVYGLRGGETVDLTVPPFADIPARRLAADEDAPDLSRVLDLWEGRSEDAFAEAVVLGTAALALFTAGRAPDVPAAEALARDLWAARLG
ncbi:glycosyl transferase family protein [Paroceanicella profunda]|uniref:Glycosyl transferase family protein n=1 Tax=Paroceanicella profunda TaxID=2579971 RepID=A0A5B8FIH3_9RHOB|nr:glycosyl transferase family protein [Paroceanicella profunda]QDL93068.1 glycosyl transferase family protein [Paroceanicella profunda]